MATSAHVPVQDKGLPEDCQNRRLWIGNLDPRVTEFVLLKLLQQHGAIEKFDLLYHKSGPLVGQPRGYAFVTYKTGECAASAMDTLNGKMLGKKPLHVKQAFSVSKKEKPFHHISALAGAKTIKKIKKSSAIEAIETKLKTMETASSDFEISSKPTISTCSHSSSAHQADLSGAKTSPKV